VSFHGLDELAAAFEFFRGDAFGEAPLAVVAVEVGDFLARSEVGGASCS